jgi:hypothetical protein
MSKTVKVGPICYTEISGTHSNLCFLHIREEGRPQVLHDGSVKSRDAGSYTVFVIKCIEPFKAQPSVYIYINYNVQMFCILPTEFIVCFV